MQLGADLVGMVFHVHSRRVCEIPVAQEIMKLEIIKPKVLVFGHDDKDYIMNIYSLLRGLMVFLQLPADHEHYDEIESLVSSTRIIPSYSVRTEIDDSDLSRWAANSLMILDNSAGIGIDGKPIAGGTGKTFNWKWVRNIQRPYLLAGGLSPDNIESALQEVAPFGVDVAGGVESSPGIKDHGKMHRFMQLVKANLFDENR